jgi:aminoglycoside 2'-N-acetyltransferase I
MVELRSVAAAEEPAAVRRLLDQAFGDRFDDDWRHTVGGRHLLALEAGSDTPLAHAAVAARTLVAGGRSLRAGQVEKVATRPDRRRAGLATLVLRGAERLIAGHYQPGALSDGSAIPGFCERLGWRPWQGPTHVACPDGPRRTPDDDGDVLVLPTAESGELDLAGPLVCDWRAGDVW